MRLYCISDMHGNLGGLDPSGCDICIIAGDFAKMNGWGKWHINDMKKWIQKRFIPWMQKCPDIEFVIVPGNHDLIFDNKLTESYSDMDYTIEWPANVHILIDEGIELKGLKFYGTPRVPVISYRWAFESEHDTLVKRFNAIPGGLDVLVTHTPPRLERLDFSIQTSRGPFGSSELTEAICAKRPRYVLCGHIHSGRHGQFQFGDSRIYNVARVDENYDIAYEPTIIDIQPKTE